MKGFRSHHPPSLDFSWRNVRKSAQSTENDDFGTLVSRIRRDAA